MYTGFQHQRNSIKKQLWLFAISREILFEMEKLFGCNVYLLRYLKCSLFFFKDLIWRNNHDYLLLDYCVDYCLGCCCDH